MRTITAGSVLGSARLMALLAAAGAAVLVGGGCDSAKVDPAPAPRGPETTRAPDITGDAGAADRGPGNIVLPDGGPSGDASLSGCPRGLTTDDRDQDGYTVGQGDCNDCDKQANPGAFDLPGNMIDEDCSLAADDEPADCETGLPLDGDPFAAARALGICRTVRADAQGKERTWGLIRAAYVFPDGTTGSLPAPPAGSASCGQAGTPPNPLSHGILPAFGTAVKPRRGPAMVALSTGIARSGEKDVPPFGLSPSAAEMCTLSLAAPGFPVSSYSTCGDIELGMDARNANDAIALELVVRVPTNAAALAFDFDFYTYEYDEYVCSEYNDHFVALLKSGAPGLPANQNIAFDSQTNPVSVNNGFVEVCRPFTYQGTKGTTRFTREFPCKLGIAELAGTGFEGHAATGWLQTRSSVLPGEEITLRFAIWDAGDEILDSTVLLDNFRWDAMPGNTVTTRAPPVE